MVIPTLTMESMLLLVILKTAVADVYIWSGKSMAWNSADAWYGVGGTESANPNGPIFPTTTMFGGASGSGVPPVTARASGTSDVGVRLGITPGSRLEIAFGARINMNSPTNTRPPIPTVATFLPSLPAFLNAAATGNGSSRSAGFDFNCPMNYRSGGNLPIDAPQGDDTVTIPDGSNFVSTFGMTVRVRSIVVGTSPAFISSTQCSNYTYGLTSPGSPTMASSTLNFGVGTTGCTRIQFNGPTTGQPVHCGNLIATVLPATIPSNVVTLYTCRDGSANCTYGGTATIQQGSSMTLTQMTPSDTGVYAYSVTGANGTVLVNPFTGQVTSVTLSPTPSPVSPPGRPSISGLGGGSSIGDWWLVIVIIAVLVFTFIVIVVKKNKKRSGKANSDAENEDTQKKSNTTAFNNPIYDIDDEEAAGPTTSNIGYLDIDDSTEDMYATT